MAEDVERRAKALAMRLAGLDYDTIATRCGYPNRLVAAADINAVLEASLTEQQRATDVLREQELLRLDRLQAGAWQAAAGGDQRAVDTVLRIIDARCRLLGLGAPQRHEVVKLDAVDDELRRLADELGQAEQIQDTPHVE